MDKLGGHDYDYERLERRVIVLERGFHALTAEVEADELSALLAFAELNKRVTALEAAAGNVRSNTIIQNGDTTMAKSPHKSAVAVVGIAAGGTGSFTAIPSPSNSAYATPPVWTSDSPLASPVVDTSDPTGATVTVTPGASLDGSSFNLTVSYSNPDGSVSTPGTLNVPVGGIAPPPPPVNVQSNSIQQNS